MGHELTFTSLGRDFRKISRTGVSWSFAKVHPGRLRENPIGSLGRNQSSKLVCSHFEAVPSVGDRLGNSVGANADANKRLGEVCDLR